ncbi:beta carbonic anhydrase 5, chloroplastic [Euphorbia lathyris]|uniref:beta carbonic anhydrase 5, chloroplastic n=1 Tax=Euphorbia lathyris TaxID=212925 RepID=UPI003313C515
MASLSPSSSVSKEPFSSPSPIRAPNSKSSSLTRPNILDSRGKLSGNERTQLKLGAVSNDFNDASLKLKAQPPVLVRECKSAKMDSPALTKNERDLFDEMKQRFMSFKKQKYMENLEHFESLAKGQAPKFMVIACADSRVCPSNILGFQPGEAFVVRNVANMVPSYESGPSETNAALEFAVNSLKVENILVIGHSCCGGIRALMSMHDDVETSSFIGSWVSVGMNARLRTKASASNLSFDRQCRHCEKESVNWSLRNLVSYPWIEEKLKNEELSIHGGYYNFVDCTFEKWTLDYKTSNLKHESGTVAVKDQMLWC